MKLLDTHTWYWWVASPELLPKAHRAFLDTTTDSIAVSMMSLWEVAMLESKGRIEIPKPLLEWFYLALDLPGIEVLDLSREIVVESTHLPGTFHGDPADRLIVASSRVFNIPILTSDKKIREYAFVEKVKL